MDITFTISTLIAATGAMILGGLWYSPILFGNTWKRLAQPSENVLSPAITYAGAFILLIVAAAVFGAFIGRDAGLGFALIAGLSAGVAWAAGSLWISYLFESRPLRLALINGGYHVAQYCIFGLVFGLI